MRESKAALSRTDFSVPLVKFVLSQPANLQKKQCGGVFFDDMALHIECRFDKNSLLQRYFLAILPAGVIVLALVIELSLIHI